MGIKDMIETIIESLWGFFDFENDDETMEAVRSERRTEDAERNQAE